MSDVKDYTEAHSCAICLTSEEGILCVLGRQSYGRAMQKKCFHADRFAKQYTLLFQGGRRSEDRM